MPITRISRGNFLHGVGNRSVRSAINALGPHASTCYELTTPAGTTAGLNGPNRIYNSATLTAEPNLSMDVVGNAVYNVFGVLALAINTAANGIKLDFNAGSATIITGTMGGFVRYSLANGTTLTVPLTALNTLADGGATNSWVLAEIDFTCQFAQSGTLQLEFAQHAAAANATDILPGSFITATPLDHVVESA